MATAIDLIRSSQGQARTTAADAAAADDALQEFLDDAADMGSARLDDFERFEEFYEGEHGVELTDRAREFLEVTGIPFCENFCEPVVDMVAERLGVTGFQATIEGRDEDDEGASALADWLADVFWGRNRLDAVQAAVHTQTLVKSEGFGIVGFDNEARRPTFDFNRPECMKAVYDGERPDRMLYAVKRWDCADEGPSNPSGRKITRLNLYFPDRIERWFKLHNSSRRGGWQRWIEQGEDGAALPWPTPWVDGDGRPLGIPVVHFRNNAKGRRTGRSEIRSVIPQQLLLNKQVVDLAMVLDSQGWPQRWASGVDPTTTALKVVPGEVWTTGNDNARFGQFDTADLQPVLAAIDSTLSRIARRSGMPLHLLTGGDMPSGESIRASEARLVFRVKDRQVVYGNAWEDAAHMAIRLARLAEALPVDVDPALVTLSTLWEDPESRDDLQEAQTAEAYHRLGVSKRTLLRRLGFDPDLEEEQRKAEAEEAMAGAVVELMNGNADRTEPDDDGPPPPAR